MLKKIWLKIKDWVWVIVAGAVGLLLWNRKPKWVKEKAKEIKLREENISNAKEKASNSKIDYEEVKKKHDEQIEQAEEPQDAVPFDDPDDAASFIDDILNRR